MATIKNPLTIVQGGGGTLTSYGSIKYLDGNNVEQTLDLSNEDYFLELTIASGSGSTFRFGDLSITNTQITELTVADGVQYLPDNFMNWCSNLTKVTLPSSIHYIGSMVFNRCNVSNPINIENVRAIGTYFLAYNANFNSPIYLSHVDIIGDYFLNNCASFNSTVTLNSSMEKIGSYFLNNCSSFAQTLTIPTLQTISNTYNPGTYFMRGCNNFVGPLVCNTVPNGSSDNYTLATPDSTALMYTTGVTLTGTYAQEWKNGFADRSSNPFRKLIVGS